MANAIYPLFKTSLGVAAADVALNLDTTQDGVYVALEDTDTHAYSASDQYYSALSGLVGTDQRVTTNTFGTVAAGVFDGDNVTFTSVTGASVEALIFYRHNAGANTTWRLVCFLDTNVTNLPVTPNGGNIALNWAAGGIFGL